MRYGEDGDERAYKSVSDITVQSRCIECGELHDWTKRNGKIVATCCGRTITINPSKGSIVSSERSRLDI